MEVALLTIFPKIFDSFLSESLIGKARAKGLVKFDVRNIRDFATGPHKSVDDSPYGGGAGMVMSVEPLVAAIDAAKDSLPDAHTVLLTPSGRQFSQEVARELSAKKQLIFVCGRYEGIDERVSEIAVDDEISIGDFVLMGGEVAAMAILEAVLRLVPDVIGNAQSLTHESFSDNLALEAPQYTRPLEFRGHTVPDVLLSGNHAKIAAWRSEQSAARTKSRRPELIAGKAQKFDKVRNR